MNKSPYIKGNIYLRGKVVEHCRGKAMACPPPYVFPIVISHAVSSRKEGLDARMLQKDMAGLNEPDWDGKGLQRQSCAPSVAPTANAIATSAEKVIASKRKPCSCEIFVVS